MGPTFQSKRFEFVSQNVFNDHLANAANCLNVQTMESYIVVDEELKTTPLDTSCLLFVKPFAL